MSFTAKTDPVPIKEDVTGGALRVGDSRVLLELVIHAFQDGATPEMILQQYSTLKLADVYAVVTYYLNHQDEINDYLARREQQAEEVQQKFESVNGDLSVIRARIAATRQM